MSESDNPYEWRGQETCSCGHQYGVHAGEEPMECLHIRYGRLDCDCKGYDPEGDIRNE